MRGLVGAVDMVLVVGSPNSSNANRLREVAEGQGVPAHLVERAAELDPAWFQGRRRIGVTAGASTPELLVQAVCARLRELGAAVIRELPGPAETMRFRLPEELRAAL